MISPAPTASAPPPTAIRFSGFDIHAWTWATMLVYNPCIGPCVNAWNQALFRMSVKYCGTAAANAPI